MVEGPKVWLKKKRVQKFCGKQLVQCRRKVGSISQNNVEESRTTEEMILLEDIQVIGKEMFLLFTNKLIFRIHYGMNGSERVVPLAWTLRNSSTAINLFQALTAADEKEGMSLLSQHSRKILTCLFEFTDCCFYLFDTNVTILSPSKSEQFTEYYQRNHWKDTLHPSFNFENYFHFIENEVLLSLSSRHRDCTLQEILLDQSIFPGVGNIIKCESLFFTKLSPFLFIKDLSSEQLRELLNNVYSFSWAWYRSCESPRSSSNKSFQYKIYGKQFCPTCSDRVRLIRDQSSMRITYYCEHCQVKAKDLPSAIEHPVNTLTEQCYRRTTCEFCGYHENFTQECEICGQTLKLIQGNDNQKENVQPLVVADSNSKEMTADDRQSDCINTIFFPRIKCSSCLESCNLARVRKGNDNIHRLFWMCQSKKSPKCSFFAWADGRFPRCSSHKDKVTILRRVLKNNINNGRYFFACSTSNCSFFLWLDDYCKSSSLLTKRSFHQEEMNQQLDEKETKKARPNHVNLLQVPL
eukprot:gene7158-7730_t